MPDEIFTALGDMFPDTMLVSGFISADERGKRTYSAGVTIPCQVRGQNRVVKDLEGNNKLSTVRAICQGSFDLSPYSKYQLPERFSPREPAVINVTREPDENGAHHETVFFE